ncbi:hypothetical protein SmJEL517_g03658 [Synchytrium microbalum]|uniref:EF-hand domain-containing protein n=1 Tax=Synchytrium microbalum TaxID=1806994 RepID=A0A507C7E6_9FUNG|nr:uncharacterized protein SmJEL517_g03658 [Synchytrium microbalum]TPX33453.1 hypothetical protein SmJEL517_g03658 [Synchytrium microbalum]
MGNTESLPLSATELAIMEECTFFTRHEILQVYSKFMSLVVAARRHGANTSTTPMSPNSAEEDVRSGKKRRKSLSKVEFAETEELRSNPFRERIADVFSADGCQVNFDDYLDFASVFSEEAGHDVKSFYAFRIYDSTLSPIRTSYMLTIILNHVDHNNDGYLDETDIRSTLEKIVGSGLSEEDKVTVTQKVIEESDMDGDGRISFVEFEHILQRSPEFIENFRIRVI